MIKKKLQEFTQIIAKKDYLASIKQYEFCNLLALYATHKPRRILLIRMCSMKMMKEYFSKEFLKNTKNFLYTLKISIWAYSTYYLIPSIAKQGKKSK